MLYATANTSPPAHCTPSSRKSSASCPLPSISTAPSSASHRESFEKNEAVQQPRPRRINLRGFQKKKKYRPSSRRTDEKIEKVSCRIRCPRHRLLSDDLTPRDTKRRPSVPEPGASISTAATHPYGTMFSTLSAPSARSDALVARPCPLSRALLVRIEPRPPLTPHQPRFVAQDRAPPPVDLEVKFRETITTNR